MRANAWILGLALSAGVCAGCVDRRYVVTTDPPGAIVYRNGQYLGASPVDDYYLYYGTYHYTIVKEGFETLQVDQPIKAPWYEYVPLDFVSETLVPVTIVDRREFHFQLQPRKVPNQAQLLELAGKLREKGLALGPGTKAEPPEPVLPQPQEAVDPNAPPPLPGDAVPPGNPVFPPPGIVPAAPTLPAPAPR